MVLDNQGFFYGGVRGGLAPPQDFFQDSGGGGGGGKKIFGGETPPEGGEFAGSTMGNWVADRIIQSVPQFFSPAAPFFLFCFAKKGSLSDSMM